MAVRKLNHALHALPPPQLVTLSREEFGLEKWDFENRLELLNELNAGAFRVGLKFRIAKRLFDVSAAVLALIVLSPLLFLIALAIKLESKGPILFRQHRVGEGLKVFRINKFRTMYVNSSDVAEPVFDQKMGRFRRRGPSEDPRITRVGAFLRRWSLDELPQFANILTDGLSLIGPRPLTVSESLMIPGAAFCRYSVPGGISGLAQVSERNAVLNADRFKHDIDYVKNLGFKQEIAIILKTFRAIRDKS